MNEFAVWIGLGATLGLAWVAIRVERADRSTPRLVRQHVDAGLALMAGALIGGRLAYVLVNWAYFSAHAVEMPQVWLGGLAWPGVITGSLIGLALYARWARMNPAALADSLRPLALLLILSAWMACWETGIAYGKASSGWWAMPARDEWGEMARRTPVQPMAALLTLFAFWLVDHFNPRLRHPGQAASLILTFLALEMFSVSFLRADPAPVWQNLRLDTWAGMIFIGLAVSFCLAAFWLPSRNRLEPLDTNRPS